MPSEAEKARNHARWLRIKADPTLLAASRAQTQAAYQKHKEARTVAARTRYAAMKADPVAWARYKAAWRARYHARQADPAARAARQASARAYQAKHKEVNNKANRERAKATYSPAARKAKYEALKANPAALARVRERERAYYARYYANPINREKIDARKKASQLEYPRRYRYRQLSEAEKLKRAQATRAFRLANPGRYREYNTAYQRRYGRKYRAEEARRQLESALSHVHKVINRAGAEADQA